MSDEGGEGADAATAGRDGGRATTGVLWTAIGNWGNQLVTLLVFTVLARLLDPEAFGVVAFASVFLALVKVLAEQGMADAVVQRLDLTRTHLDTAFWASAVVGVGLAAALAASAPLVARLASRDDLAPVLAGLSVSVAIAGLGNVQKGLLTRRLAFGSLAARSLASSLGGGVVGIAMALAGAGVWALVGQTVAFEVFGVATVWAASDWRPGRRFDRTAFRELGRFGAGVVGHKVLNFLSTRSDNFVVGLVLGAQPLGLYVIAYRLLQLLLDVTTAIIGTVSFPVLSRVQQDVRAVVATYLRVVRLTALLAFPAFAGVAVVADEVVRVVFGPGWSGSVPVVRVLALAGAAQSVLFVNGTVLKSLGRPGLRAWVTALTAGLGVAAFVVVVDAGIVAVAAAVAGVTLAVAPVWLWATRRLVPLRVSAFLRQLVTPAVCSGAMVAAVAAVRPLTLELPALLALLVLVPVGVAVYVTALRLVDGALFAEAAALAASAVGGLGSARRGTA